MATQTELSAQPKNGRSHRLAENSAPAIVANKVTKVSRTRVEPPTTHDLRHELIAVTAYYLAQGRNFEPGHEEEDWLAAEAQIRRVLGAPT